MENLERLTYLLECVRERTATGAECQELIDLIRLADAGGIDAGDGVHVVEAIDAFHAGGAAIVLPDFSTDEWRAPLRAVLDVDRVDADPVVRRGLWASMRSGVRWVAAAVVAGLLLMGGWFFLGRRGAGEFAGRTILPGRNGAVLTLSDHRQILLDSVVDGVIAEEGGAAVRLSDGKIAYGKTEGDEIVYNTLSTPRGRQFRVILPDGTAVWLNAASMLRYPAVFRDSVRSVELEGEAYFEVAADKAHPFIVRAGGQRLRVLGTHFNINAYTDEPSVRTVLVEGGVRVDAGAASVVLKPGEGSVLTGNVLTWGPADVEEATAWKNGYFVFNSEDIHPLMRKLARWYDVAIVYEEDVKASGFNGTVQRFADISQVLHKLELTNEVHFKIEGRTIMISK